MILEMLSIGKAKRHSMNKQEEILKRKEKENILIGERKEALCRCAAWVTCATVILSRAPCVCYNYSLFPGVTCYAIIPACPPATYLNTYPTTRVTVLFLPYSDTTASSFHKPYRNREAMIIRYLSITTVRPKTLHFMVLIPMGDCFAVSCTQVVCCRQPFASQKVAEGSMDSILYRLLFLRCVDGFRPIFSSVWVSKNDSIFQEGNLFGYEKAATNA
jgi:hypothetical protein